MSLHSGNKRHTQVISHADNATFRELHPELSRRGCDSVWNALQNCTIFKSTQNRVYVSNTLSMEHRVNRWVRCSHQDQLPQPVDFMCRRCRELITRTTCSRSVRSRDGQVNNKCVDLLSPVVVRVCVHWHISDIATGSIFCSFDSIFRVPAHPWKYLIFFPKFKALKVLENRTGAWKSLNSPSHTVQYQLLC